MKNYFSNIIFILSISTVITGISNYIIPIDLPYKEYFIPVLFQIVYIIILTKKRINKNLLIKYSIIFLPLILLYLFELLRYIYLPGRSIIGIYVSFITIISFVIFVSINITENPSFLKKSVRLYWIFNYIIAMIACVTFILLAVNIIQIDNWTLPNYFSENFKIKNQLQGIEVYSVPFHLTVIMKEYIKPLGFISEFGSFSGLSYEPHLATFFMTPAFLMTFNYYDFTIKNAIYFLPFIVFFLLAYSLTNIIGLVFVFLFYLLFFGINRNKVKIILLLLVSFCISIIYFYADIVDLYYLYTSYSSTKIESRSGDETIYFVRYILSPETLMGYGVFNIPTNQNNYFYSDIGLLSSLLLVVFYLTFFIKTIQNYVSNNKIKTLIGIYFLIHSIKFPMHVVLYPYTAFLLIYIYDEKIKYDS